MIQLLYQPYQSPFERYPSLRRQSLLLSPELLSTTTAESLLYTWISQHRLFDHERRICRHEIDAVCNDAGCKCVDRSERTLTRRYLHFRELAPTGESNDSSTRLITVSDEDVAAFIADAFKLTASEQRQLLFQRGLELILSRFRPRLLDQLDLVIAEVAKFRASVSTD